MNSLEFMWNLKDLNTIIELLKMCFIILYTYLVFVKIANVKKISNEKWLVALCIPIISIISIFIKRKTDSYFNIVVLILLISIISVNIFKKNVFYSILITAISLSISYAVYIISVILAFAPIIVLGVKSDYINFIIIICIFLIFMNIILKSRKVKNGFDFLENKIENSYFSVMLFNISYIVLFLIIILQNDINFGTVKIGETFLIFCIIMFLIIKQSFDLYYKQNLLTKELEETKKELEEKKQEIDKLEKENLEFSKTSHSLAHKQKALEFKLEQLMKTDIDAENKETIKEEIEKVSKELYKEPNEVELTKTEIESIDNMFSYMQSECIKNNIKFELQVVGNIYYMINNLITENDLEILIADHIKDAIIAINHSDNLNRSILVRIGKIDNVYSLYIYDSGIEFTKEVLDNLGKKPITTHADTGGTGMGFMNTFDTLNKTKASLIINEIGNPCEDNYTKVLIFKFDNQNEFNVNSYKNEIVV